MEKSFGDIKKVLDANTFKYEVLIAFWLAVHLGKFESVKLVYELDPVVEKVVSNLRIQGQELLQKDMQKKEEKKKKGMFSLFSKKQDQADSANAVVCFLFSPNRAQATCQEPPQEGSQS